MKSPSSPRFGSRPGTAPPETAHAGAVSLQRSSTRPQTATARQQLESSPTGASLPGKPMIEGEHWDEYDLLGDDEYDLLGDLANESPPAPAVKNDLSRIQRFKQFSSDIGGVDALTGKCWQPQVWLSLRRDAINKNEKYLLPLSLRIVLASTKKAIQQQTYEVFQPANKAPKGMKVRLEEEATKEATLELREHDTFSTVDLSHVLCSAPSIKWYANARNTQTWDDHQPEEVGRDAVKEAAVVTDVHPLNSAVTLSKSMPGMPIMVVAEVTEFDEHGDIDLRYLSSLGPDDLLLRTDLLRFLEHIKREVRGSNQKNSIKNNTTMDYLRHPSAPFLIRCRGVSIMRGPLEEGFPFYKEPTRVDIILMSMAHPRPQMMKVVYRTAPFADWYDDISPYNSLIERLCLISHIARTDIKEEHGGTKPILIMNVPGAYSNAQQPWDAVKTGLKHWKQTFFGDFYSFQIVCRNRFGPDIKMAGIIRKAINCKPQPAPGLDTESRRSKETTKKPRAKNAVNVLPDPSDDEEDDALGNEAHKLLRQMQKDSREMALEVAVDEESEFGGKKKKKGWTEASIMAIVIEKRRVCNEMTKSKEAEREEMNQLLHNGKQVGPTMLRRAMALADRSAANAFGCMPQDHDFISSSDDESCEGEARSDERALRPKRRAYSEQALRPKWKINRSFSRFSSKSAVALMDQTKKGRHGRRKTEAKIANINAHLGKQMERQIAEEDLLVDLAKKSMVAKAAAKMIEDSKVDSDKRMEQRKNTSIAGRLGAGADFVNYFGGTLLEHGSSKNTVGAHSWQGTEGNRRPMLSGREWMLDKRLCTNAYMDKRAEHRQGFNDPEYCFSAPDSRRSAALAASPPSKMNDVQEVCQESNTISSPQMPSQKRHVKPFETATLGEVDEKQEETTSQKRPQNRPFASKEVQFRRRTLRETIQIYRAAAADHPSRAGIREIEVATADQEAEILKLAGQVKHRMERFTYQHSEGKVTVTSPWLQKFQS